MQKIFRFLLGGGINTLFTYIVYLIFLHWVHYQVAYVIAYALGIIFSYWFNLSYVFKKRSHWKKIIVYPFVYIFQYVMNAFILEMLVQRLGLNKVIAPLVVILLSLPITYCLVKFVLNDNEENNSDK